VADSKAPYHLRPDVVEIHQAIGRYITVFSEVMATMRHGIGLFLGPTDAEFRPPDPLLETLFAQMTADPIRAALFAISSQVSDLNDGDRSIRKALQTIVQHYIRLRNDIAHADWAVGWEVVDTGELIPPAASKIKLAKDGIEHTSLPFTVDSSDARLITSTRSTDCYESGLTYAGSARSEISQHDRAIFCTCTRRARMSAEQSEYGIRRPSDSVRDDEAAVADAQQRATFVP
jgi:hypothetical protein